MALRRSSTERRARYTPAGDEFLFVEFDEAMSLEVNLEVQAIAKRVQEASIPGVIDVCPANVSFLLRYDPDEVSFDELTTLLSEVERGVRLEGLEPFETRIIDVPVLFNDPWTHEVLMKFRDRVQDPSKTDIEYLTDVNGLGSVDNFIEAITSTPHMVTLTGFAPGVVWSFQLVPADRQIQGPKYLRPRTETPDRAFALGGAFTAVYPSPSACGYPLLGRAAAPVYDPSQRLRDFSDHWALVGIGDICNYRPVDRSEYDRIQAQVAAGTYTYLKRPVMFEPSAFFNAPEQYCNHLTEALQRD